MSGATRTSPSTPWPSGRLRDGTAYYGQLGVMANDADEDRVQCHLCGDWYRRIGGTHLTMTHGWTTAEYRDAFQLPAKLPSCSRGLCAVHRAHAARQIQDGTGFGLGRKGGVPLDERRPGAPRWRSLSFVQPDLLDQLHPQRNGDLDVSAIGARSNQRLWWCCEACGHEWQASVGSRTKGHGCPACYDHRRQGPRTVSRERSLAALHPELSAEWDHARNQTLDPEAISPGTHHTVWWRCATCGHQWRGSVENRAAGHGCPICAVKRRAQGRSRVAYDRSLAAKHPDLTRELHRQLNPGIDAKQLAARSSQKVWWRCSECGHEWKTMVCTRTNGSGCPRCGLARRAHTQSHVEPARSLAVKHPRIAAELHPTRNPGTDPTRLAARSSLTLWWRCPDCGHEWITRVSTRTRGSGCPACARARRTRQ